VKRGLRSKAKSENTKRRTDRSERLEYEPKGGEKGRKKKNTKLAGRLKELVRGTRWKHQDGMLEVVKAIGVCLGRADAEEDKIT